MKYSNDNRFTRKVNVTICFFILMAMISGDLFAGAGQDGSAKSKAQQAHEAKTMRQLFNIKKLPREVRNAETIRLLKVESLEKSLSGLHGHLLYRDGKYLMMSNKEYFAEELVQRMALTDIEAIMGNRRVLKIYQQLSQINEKKASELVSKEILYSLSIYGEVYERYLQVNGDNFKKAAKSGRSHGFAFSESDNNRITVRQMRYKVLALCFLASQLELDCSEALKKVIDFALEQLEMFSDKSMFRRQDGFDMRAFIGICNKQILGMGIVGATLKDDKKELGRNLGLKWKQRKLTSFEAITTETEPKGHIPGLPKADYSKGAFDVEYIEEISDEQFDYLLHNLNQ